jgi:hypothetical protein
MDMSMTLIMTNTYDLSGIRSIFYIEFLENSMNLKFRYANKQNDMTSTVHSHRQGSESLCTNLACHFVKETERLYSKKGIFTNVYISTGSLFCRQSQQSFNTLTPFLFSFLTHYKFSAPTGHLQVRYTIRYFKDYF